jgi:Zn-dependent protease with chaperone function
MTREDFEALVRRLEVAAAARPRAYRLRVLALIALGYAYVFGALLLAIGLVVALGFAASQAGRAHGALLRLVAKLGWALAAVAVAIARALWVRFDAPQGIPLARGEHPELFAAIERVRRHMRAPRAHRVVLSDDFNAGVVQQPRLGVLGWQRNHLVLGLPLLQALSREQFEAVLAHEYGHLSGSHGKLGGWIYRTNVTIQRLAAKMESERHWASFVFLPFFRWFYPLLHATSFVQRRAQEYAADQGGAELAGARQMADALLALNLRGAFLDEDYWPRIRRRAAEAPRPDIGPYSALAPAVFEGVEPARADAWLARALERETGVDDSHPSLRDRLRALGEAPRIPPGLVESAAASLLGDALPRLAAALDASWREAVAPSWEQRFERVREARRRLAELDARAAGGALSAADAFERAELVEEQRDESEALPLYRQVLAREPGHVGARFALGRLLAGRDDPEGLSHLDAAIAAHRSAVIPACQHAYAFLRRAGRVEEAERYADRARRHQSLLEQARAERDVLRLDGRYEGHGLPQAELGPLLASLRQVGDVERAWLVRRQVEHFPESPLFALGVRRRPRGLLEKLSSRRRKRRDLELQKRLEELPFPGECFILVLNHRGRKERAIFEGVAGTQLLRPD